MNYVTEEEKEFMANNFGVLSLKEIGKALERNPGVVGNILRKRGIKKNIRWNKKDDKTIKNNIGKMSPSEMAKELFPDRSLSSIFHRIQELGLQKNKPRYSKDNNFLLKELSRVSKEIGRTPMRKELTSLYLPSEVVWTSRFGSYGEACVLAGITPNKGFVKRNISKVGENLCLSNSEAKITRFLLDKNIQFEKEVKYSKFINIEDSGNLVCDWVLYNDIFVEFFGMERNKRYIQKMKRKISLCKKHGIRLISIMEEDINSLDVIFKEFI